MSGHKTENSENNFIEKTALTIVPDDALSASASEEETPVDDLHVTDVTIVQGDHPAGPVPGEESASKGKASADNAYVTDVTIVQEDHPATPLPDGDATPDSAHASGAVPPGARHDTDMTMLQHEPLPASSSSRGNGDQLQPGDRLDRYVIVKKLGQGGMGSVYLVRHETLGVFRAAKVLSSELYARGGEFVKRFVQEAKLACSISNPNIVNVLDVCDDPERACCYIIMEYVDGGTVRDVLHEVSRFSEIHAVMIVEAVAEALQAASEQKIVHRDIKPDNIMLTRRGVVKLADLGIAKNTEDNVKLTRTHIMMGTPAYLAPEQAKDAHSVDARADIYSLGATFYEMLTGQIPYPGKNTYDILSKLASDPVPDPRSIVESISPQTARLVMKMLAKQPKQRHRNAAELLKDIRTLNILSPDCDKEKSIRELLEQSGQGSYSAVSLTPTLGNPVSTWLMRHVWLRMETMLRHVPIFATLLDRIQSSALLFYAVVALLTLLIIGVPLTLFLYAGRNEGAGVSSYEFSGTEIPSGVEHGETLSPTPSGAEQGENRRDFPVVEPELSTPPAKPLPEPEAAAGAGESARREAEDKAKREAEARAKQAAEELRLERLRVLEESRKQKEAAARRAAQEAERRRQQQRRSAAPGKSPATAPASRIPAYLEITPVGAEFILRNDAGKEIMTQKVSSKGRIQISVPEGQYRVQVSAPGFHTVERPFPVSRTRTISCVKIDLKQEFGKCVIYLYGSAKLLEFLKANAPELRVDDGEWKRVREFPYTLELAASSHTIQLRGKGIFSMNRVLDISLGEKKRVVEFFLRQKEAVLEIVSRVPGEISINLQGVWEPLKKTVPIAPFRAFTLKWRDSRGEEGQIEIPELAPESVCKVEIVPKKIAAVGGAAEFAEAEKLLKAREYETAIEKLKLADEKGHPEAMYVIGLLNEQGKGRWFSSDSDALANYRKAASPPFNNAKAQYKMGLFYEEGRGGLDRDIVKALEWYKKAALQKNPDGLFRVGMALKNGDGNEPVDYEKMIRCFTEAAQSGLVEAQYQLGYCYENGIGVPLSIIQAKHWYGKAAKQNHRDAARRFQALEGMQ